MQLSDLIEHYGTCYKFSKATGMSIASYYNWEKKGYIPVASQARIQIYSDNALKYDIKHLGIDNNVQKSGS